MQTLVDVPGAWRAPAGGSPSSARHAPARKLEASLPHHSAQHLQCNPVISCELVIDPIVAGRARQNVSVLAATLRSPTHRVLRHQASTTRGRHPRVSFIRPSVRLAHHVSILLCLRLSREFVLVSRLEAEAPTQARAPVALLRIEPPRAHAAATRAMQRAPSRTSSRPAPRFTDPGTAHLPEPHPFKSVQASTCPSTTSATSRSSRASISRTACSKRRRARRA